MHAQTLFPNTAILSIGAIEEQTGSAAPTTPGHIHGTVLLSAGDQSGCEWPSATMNPYRNFNTSNPPN
jgi:hypothetical protein